MESMVQACEEAVFQNGTPQEPLAVSPFLKSQRSFVPHLWDISYGFGMVVPLHLNASLPKELFFATHTLDKTTMLSDKDLAQQESELKK